MPSIAVVIPVGAVDDILAAQMRAVLAQVLGLPDSHRARVALTPGSHFVVSWLASAPPLLLRLQCAD